MRVDRFAAALLFTAMLGGCSSAPEVLPVRPIDRNAIEIVHGFGAKHRSTFAVSDDEYARLRSQFEPAAATPADERQQVRYGVAILEQIAGAHTPASQDVGQNLPNPGGPGQMDCRDEAANTTTYLQFIRQEGLLHHHDVMTPTFRSPYVFDPHNSAQIRDRQTGTLYVVDTWFLDNGWLPYIQEVEPWKRKVPFPADLNRPLDPDPEAEQPAAGRP